tara:strand:- start:827 stop:1327 length:501 start_codon:yes stop_codon:yes gene_type:complete
MNNKKQNNNDNALRVLGSNGYLLRDEILNILLRDETIHELIGGGYSDNYEHLYWDDADLVSTHYKNRTIASIGYSDIKKESDQKQTIGDMKKDIIAFCARQRRKIEEHNDTMNITINCLNDIYENILSDVFYDMRWDDLENEYEDKQNDMLVALEKAIDIIKKERK